MIEEIRNYFLKNVSLTKEFDNILADFLGDEATSYTIEPIPVEPVLRQYRDGGSLNQYVFQFGSREFYDNSVAQNISNLGFYERYSKYRVLDTRHNTRCAKWHSKICYSNENNF